MFKLYIPNGKSISSRITEKVQTTYYVLRDYSKSNEYYPANKNNPKRTICGLTWVYYAQFQYLQT